MCSSDLIHVRLRPLELLLTHSSSASASSMIPITSFGHEIWLAMRNFPFKGQIAGP